MVIFFCVLIVIFIALLGDESLKGEKFWIFVTIWILIFFVMVLTVPSV
mgnify:CR=1